MINNFPYFIPYILSFLITFAIGIITWHRREVRGAKVYAILAFIQCSIPFGYIMELASPALDGKMLWDDFQWLGYLAWSVLLPIFSLQFTRSEQARRPRTWILLSIVPALFLILLVSNPIHGLVHHDEWLLPVEPFGALRYDFTPVFWIYAIYGDTIVALALANLLWHFFRADQLYRAQVGAIVIGVSIPMLSTLLVLFGVTLSAQRDLAPLAITIGNIFVVWGLLRLHLFDLVPIAWDVVIGNMDDYVIVIDLMNRIVDLNPAAKKVFEQDGRSIVGKQAAQALAPWAEDMRPLKGQKEGRIELVVRDNDQPNHFDIHINPLQDRRGREIGRVFVARNITQRKKMEEELRLLNNNLEELVQKRTQELAEAYDSTLEGWAKALEIKDKETVGHARRVTELAVRLGHELGLEDEEIKNLNRGALLHDIGKMAIPDEILHKKGPLTEEERYVIENHPIFAYNLLKDVSFLQNAIEIPYHHHERWDGTGYPKKLKGEEIPLLARIFVIIDNWDALTADRPYRDAWPPEKVTEYLRDQSGKIFDPTIVEVFLNKVVIDA